MWARSLDVIRFKPTDTFIGQYGKLIYQKRSVENDNHSEGPMWKGGTREVIVHMVEVRYQRDESPIGYARMIDILFYCSLWHAPYAVRQRDIDNKPNQNQPYAHAFQDNSCRHYRKTISRVPPKYVTFWEHFKEWKMFNPFKKGHLFFRWIDSLCIIWSIILEEFVCFQLQIISILIMKRLKKAKKTINNICVINDKISLKKYKTLTIFQWSVQKTREINENKRKSEIHVRYSYRTLQLWMK